jgi:hypothetical protein
MDFAPQFSEKPSSHAVSEARPVLAFFAALKGRSSNVHAARPHDNVDLQTRMIITSVALIRAATV